MLTPIAYSPYSCAQQGPIISLGWRSELEPNVARGRNLAKEAVFKVMKTALFVLGGERERVFTEERFLLGRIEPKTFGFIEARVKEIIGDAFSGVDPIGSGKRTSQEVVAYLEEKILMESELQSFHGGFLDKQQILRASFNKQLFGLQEICKKRIIDIQRQNLIFLFELAFLHNISIISSPVHIDQTCTRIAEMVGRQFPEWIFRVQQLNAVTRQRFQEIVQERSRQLESMLQHFAFMWVQRLPPNLYANWQEYLAKVMPHILSVCHVEFRDIEPGEEVIVSQFSKACEQVIHVFQEAEEKGSFVSVTEETLFHPEKARWILSGEAKASIRFVVERYYRDGEKGLVLDQVKSIFSQPGIHQQCAHEAIERMFIQEVVMLKARFFSRHLPSESEAGKPIPFSEAYPLLFPDKPEHKEAFQRFCEICEKGILDSFGASITTVSRADVHACVVRSAHEAFNDLIRARALSKVSSG